MFEACFYGQSGLDEQDTPPRLFNLANADIICVDNYIRVGGTRILMNMAAHKPTLSTMQSLWDLPKSFSLPLRLPWATEMA